MSKPNAILITVALIFLFTPVLVKPELNNRRNLGQGRILAARRDRRRILQSRELGSVRERDLASNNDRELFITEIIQEIGNACSFSSNRDRRNRRNLNDRRRIRLV